MSRFFYTIACLSIIFSLKAQDPNKEALFPCGTPAGISPWLKAYAADPNMLLEERSDDTLWVALQVHLLSKDNGTGHIAYDKFLDAFCRLNKDYAPAKVQFYLKHPINLINKTEWFAHTSITKGIEMMLTNNVPDALNAYFVSNPAGNCGYNLPYAGVAISHGCAGANDHTWAHEVGHALSLPHPFIGWEGKTYNFNTPTPLQVTYDYTHFHDTLETQIPAPLDTALVEFVDGSNCSIAADLICDTKPDYLSYRWNCNSQQVSGVLQKDPNGVQFQSDGTLFMSYADDACQNRFSPEETNILRANLMTEKAHWVAPPGSLFPKVTEKAVAIEPVQDQPAPYIGAKLVWKPVPGATHYVVQASRLSTFNFREADILTTDTSAIVGELVLNLKYYWRIRAFNGATDCTQFSELYTFTTAPLTSTYAPDLEGWRFYPSLMAAGQPLSLEIPEKWRGQEAQGQIFDVAGRMLWQEYINLHSPKLQLELPSASWQTGLYYFVLTSNVGVKRVPIFIER